MIWIDFDGVIASLLPEWLRRYNRAFGDNLTHHDITHWDIDDFVKPEAKRAIFEILKEPDLYDYIEPIDQAVNALKELKRLKIEWRIATANTSVNMVAGKINWLKRHGLYNGTGWPHFFVPIREKFRLRGDMLIDDHADNLEKFQGGRILFDACHNQNASPRKFDIRTTGWESLLQWLKP